MKTTQIKLSLPYCNSIQGINNNNKKESLQVRINFWAVGIWNKRKFYPKAQPQSHPIKNLGLIFYLFPTPSSENINYNIQTEAAISQKRTITVHLQN